MKKFVAKTKEKLIGTSGGVSGGLGFLGSSYNICHAACQGVIAFLAIFGIHLTGMGPLMWLQNYSIYFWSMAFAFLFFGLYMYKKKCMSDKIVMFNAGLVIAGIPFASSKGFETPLWVIGGFFVVLSIFLFIFDKIRSKKKKIYCEVNSNGKAI